jgi:hypothetical protein
LNTVLRDAYVWGTVLSVTHSQAAAATAPRALIDLTRPWFSPLRARDSGSISSTVHQMLGFGADVQGQVAERLESHILLMQLDTDLSLGWMFGDMGNAQFWITPTDLAAGRFENVTVTVAGH